MDTERGSCQREQRALDQLVQQGVARSAQHAAELKRRDEAFRKRDEDFRELQSLMREVSEARRMKLLDLHVPLAPHDHDAALGEGSEQGEQGIQNKGKSCWTQCNKEGGPCDFCGKGKTKYQGGWCCRSDDGVRVGERCDADTQCPLTKDSPAKKHDKTATHGKCKTVKNRNIGRNNAVQKSCASLGLDTIAAAAI